MSCAKVPSSQSATYPTALDIRLVVCALAFPLTVSSLMPCTIRHSKQSLDLVDDYREISYLFFPVVPRYLISVSLRSNLNSEHYVLELDRCLDYIYNLFHLRKFAFPLSSSIPSPGKWAHYFYFWVSVRKLNEMMLANHPL